MSITPVASDELITFRLGGTLLCLTAAKGQRVRILYAGPDLPSAKAADFLELSAREHASGGPQSPIAHSLLNSIGTGHPSPPGLLSHRDRQDWALDLRLVRARQTVHSLILETRDTQCGVSVEHIFDIDEDSGVVGCTSSVSNDAETPFSLEWCAALCLPLPQSLLKMTSFAGRWAGEFQAEHSDLIRGSFLLENRSGRTGHGHYPGLYLGTEQTGESHGLAMAAQLGWSGNSRLRVDRLADGDLSFQAGELLLPGEILLERDARYSTPPLYLCWSDKGYGDVTQRLHRFVRKSVLCSDAARPVHYNSWEAVYFDHTPEKLTALAEQAASVGAERFVLDDGWFGGRRSDKAGLGDWYVSDEIYPDGLRPLADHVRSLGMEFGLWFEPEMVNPDSNLYRAHPDWVLSSPGVEQISSRHQLPLDLTRAEVCDHLFDRITALVQELGIAYIKWDMNRDIQHPGGQTGQAVMHDQIAALYTLIERIKAASPYLVIESCSSGGARADYGILELTDRVWTSDNNDALARYAIMRGAAHFLPLAALGNHVGPEKCHITGRHFDMEFRAGTAIFGHMGMEMDLTQESANDRETLSQAVALHKCHRSLIHTGEYYRLVSPKHIAAIGTVSADLNQALYQIAILDPHPETQPPRLNFAGLDPDQSYEVHCVWPKALDKPYSAFAGSALMRYGLQLPATNPDTCLIYHLKAV
ncbi:MAG: alpha-galactosidase [Erythrobacter sp.]